MANEFLNRGIAAPEKSQYSGANIDVGDVRAGGDFEQPSSRSRPQIELVIKMPNGKTESVGQFFRSFEFKGMLNGGYIIRAVLFDHNFNTHSSLIEKGYFTHTRTSPVVVEFCIRHNSPKDDQPSDGNKYKTKKQIAILTSLEVKMKESNAAHLEIIAIDPPSYYLNAGTASGKAYTGKISEVIKQVVEEYADGVKLDISMTSDSRYTKWYMMRQDPKTFIKSLLEWSSSLNKTKTNWMIGSDGFNLNIVDQGSMVSKNKGLYSFAVGRSSHTLRSCNVIADHSLSILQTQLLTHGASVISGKYWDKTVDTNHVSVRDSTTYGKKVAKLTNPWQSFIGPSEKKKPPYAGFTAIGSVPEIDSSGGLGVSYENYIDGRARRIWYNTNIGIMNAKFRVLGHGIYGDTLGLGIDTIFINWQKGEATIFPQGLSPVRTYWATGNWLMYGFHHKVTRGEWYTDIYCSRYDLPNNLISTSVLG